MTVVAKNVTGVVAIVRNAENATGSCANRNLMAMKEDTYEVANASCVFTCGCSVIYEVCDVDGRLWQAVFTFNTQL